MAYMNYSPELPDNFTGNISYQWWCEKCLDYHSTSCCPYIGDWELMSMARNGIPGICLICGQPMWGHAMTMERE